MPVIIALLVFASVLFFAEDQQALERCELTHSHDVCHATIYN